MWHVIAATNIVRDCSTQQQSSEVIVEIQEEEELLHDDSLRRELQVCVG